MENQSFRKTKVVATVGPASRPPQVIEELLKAGVDVVRLNFSHGDRNVHGQVIRDVRAASRRLNRPVSILMDLQGPKIRVGRLSKPSIELKKGDRLLISAEDLDGDERMISTTYADLYKDVKAGDRILMDDGLIEAKVRGVSGKVVECEVVYGGVLKEHKGMNLPGVNVSAQSLTDKDMEDLDFGIGQEVDYIALSFVRRRADISGLKRL